MRRREFLGVLGGVAVSSLVRPLGARAQQPAMPVIGYLGGPSPEDAPVRFAGLRQGLKEAGFVEGQNITIDYRATADRYDRFREFAFDLVRRPVDLIFTSEKAATGAARVATKTIPVVFAVSGDPVGMRLVASLMRPGANVTGVSFDFSDIAAKQLELLHEAGPNAGLIGVLTNQANANAVADATELQRVAGKLGVQLLIVNASNEHQLEAAFAGLLDRKVGGLIVEGDAFFSGRQSRIVVWSADHDIPAIYADPENAAAGGLMTYGTSIAETFRLSGVTIGRILKGEKPADLPVQQSAKNEFVVNLKTAKALNLTLPPALLATADQVIE